MLCTYLSAVLLVGLALNSLFDWLCPDPVAALVIAAVAIREGVEAWQGDSCCSPATALRAEGVLRPDAAEPSGCSCEIGCADACCTTSSNADR